MITVYAYNNNTRFDITNLITQITWRGDEPTFYRTLELSLVNDKKVTPKVGMAIQLWNGATELFRGFLFRHDRNHLKEETWIAYDEAIYLYKNFDSLIVRQQSPAATLRQLYTKYGVAINHISPISTVVSRKIFQDETLADITKVLLNAATKKTGQKYKVFSDKGRVNIQARNDAPTVSFRFSELLETNQSISIEETKTAVKTTKGELGNGGTSYTTSDAAGVKAYGMMQHVEYLDDKENLSATAKTLLAELSSPEQITEIFVVGHDSVKTGVHVIVDGIGSFYVSADEHIWANGTHLMRLQLVKKLDTYLDGEFTSDDFNYVPPEKDDDKKEDDK
jgi:hypothetical protein